MDAPNVVGALDNAFPNCSNLQSINVPKVQKLVSANFQSTKISNISLPSLTEMTGQNNFNSCQQLEWADLGSVDKIKAYTFLHCSALVYIFLRKSDGVTVNDGAQCFGNTPFVGGGTAGLTGTAFVPSALISTYQAATNWATLYSGGTCVFKALEDYTLDGTTTGEINWAKIRAEEVNA